MPGCWVRSPLPPSGKFTRLDLKPKSGDFGRNQSNGVLCPTPGKGCVASAVTLVFTEQALLRPRWTKFRVSSGRLWLCGHCRLGWHSPGHACLILQPPGHPLQTSAAAALAGSSPEVQLQSPRSSNRVPGHQHSAKRLNQRPLQCLANQNVQFYLWVWRIKTRPGAGCPRQAAPGQSRALRPVLGLRLRWQRKGELPSGELCIPAERSMAVRPDQGPGAGHQLLHLHRLQLHH